MDQPEQFAMRVTSLEERIRPFIEDLDTLLPPIAELAEDATYCHEGKTLHMRFLGVTIGRAYDEPLEPAPHDLANFAALIRHAIYRGCLKVGRVGPPMAVPLAAINTRARLMMIFYAFSDLTQAELRARMKEFFDEGDIALPADWSDVGVYDPEGMKARGVRIA